MRGAFHRVRLVDRVEARYERASHQHGQTQEQIAAPRRRHRRRPALAQAHLAQLARQAQGEKRQEQSQDLPAQQEGDDSLDHQLPEMTLLNEHHHAVEGQHHAKKRHRGAGG